MSAPASDQSSESPALESQRCGSVLHASASGGADRLEWDAMHGADRLHVERQLLCAGSLFLLLLFAGLALGSVTANAKSADPPAGPLRTLTTAREAHSLTTEQALRAYPVHLRGVVTYYDPYVDPRHIALFVHDSTGSMFVSVPAGSIGSLPAGTIVDVVGRSGSGDFAPIVASPRIRVIGWSHLPPNPPRVSLTRLQAGAEDGQWLEVEGIVHSIFESRSNVTLQLAMADGTISATTLRESGATYTTLIDAHVLVHANAAPVFNGNHQMIGARLLFPNLSAVQVLEAAPQDPFARPVLPIDSLSRFSQVAALPHRVHVRGRVTLQWPGSSLCIRDATHGLCAQTSQTTHLAIGELADVVGFAAPGDSAPVLTDAVFRNAGSGAPVVADPVTAGQALLGRDDAELIQIDGQLIGRDLASADTTLMLASDKFIFAAILPKGLTGPEVAAWKNGSKLRVTGICSVQVDAQRSARGAGALVPQAFRVLLRSPLDVLVLQSPSWWTAGHALLLMTLALMATLVVIGWVMVLRKRVEQQTNLIRESEERFRHMAQHDALTGLPTRLLLHDRLNSAIERARRYHTGLAILMLDLDNFKLINDTLGHHAGDETLCVTAERITKAVRKSDTVARMGGDEFIVLLPDLHDPREAENIAAKIVAALSVSIRIGDREVPISVSVGVCTASADGLDADALLKSVDTALYRAKAQGRNCFQLFTADMARAQIERLRLQAGLGRALERNELELHFQPMVSFESGELTGFEALLRWRSKEMGLVMPGDFIALAEESGLIVPIGEWVLREACREIGILERQLNRTLMLAVNLSPRQFQQDDLPQMIGRALADYGRSPRCVEFEITESMLMSDSSQTNCSLMGLRDLGVQLAIDDFGIGFSSLSYITRFSIDRLKIDRSFIQNCTTNGNSVAVIRAILAMAHGLDIEVVAEGIETAEQFRFLQQERCDTAQGYYLSRPVPAAQLPAMLRSVGHSIRVDAGIEVALPAQP